MQGRGQGQLAVEGLVTRMVYAWCGLSPEFMALIRAGKLQAWNFPFGVGEDTRIEYLPCAALPQAWSPTGGDCLAPPPERMRLRQLFSAHLWASVHQCFRVR